MPIPKEHHGRYIYHMTHLENLESILQNGLLSTNEKNSLGINHKNIANQGIQNRRAVMNVSCGPRGNVHNYVPFYFSPREPMLLGLLNSKNLDQQLIIYLAVDINVIDREDVVFTSASANTIETPSFYTDPQELSELRWDLIDSNKWGFSDDERHSKMAEVLIHERVEIPEIDFVVVWNESYKKIVEELFSKAGHKIKTKYDGHQLRTGRQNHYFCRFFSKGEERHSLVTGPELLNYQYKEAVKTIKEKRESGIPNPQFNTISDAILEISKDFSVIPELDKIKDLETLNTQHVENVGDHSKRVVEKIEELDEYSDFSDSQKKVLKLAGFLHDIGKGESPLKGGKQQVDNDHPANAIPLIERILSEEIENLSDRKIRQTVMLIVYHDLIGDVIGKGRDKEQILNIIRTIDDFDMLVAISKADVSSLIPEDAMDRFFCAAENWLIQINAGVPELRTWVTEQLERADD